MNPDQTRTRIFSHITRTRFLHLEDSLEISKLRLFVGEYRRGQGAQATAFHFLDADDARPLCADLSWSKPADFVDFKGSPANGGGQPQSRVLKIKGPKDGKYWLQIDNGPGQIIGEGAVKPAGEPEASISIALTVWEARKMALAVIEYMQAYRVVQHLEQRCKIWPPAEPGQGLQTRHVDPGTGEISDAEALFGPDPHAAPSGSKPERSQSRGASRHQRELDEAKARAKKEKEAEDKPTSFYELAPVAITNHGLLDLVQELVRGPLPWHEKAQRLQAAMAA